MSEAGMIVIGGLPGTGKSSIAMPLTRRLRAPYLRIDTIEQALADSGEWLAPAGVAGYGVGQRVAGDQIRLGLDVVIECVNPLAVTRAAWRAIAEHHRAWILEVETVCTDADEHRRRVEERTADVPGLALPDWRQVTEREYESWDRPHLVLDTSQLRISESVETVLRWADSTRREHGTGRTSSP